MSAPFPPYQQSGPPGVYAPPGGPPASYGAPPSGSPGQGPPTGQPPAMMGGPPRGAPSYAPPTSAGMPPASTGPAAPPGQFGPGPGYAAPPMAGGAPPAGSPAGMGHAPPAGMGMAPPTALGGPPAGMGGPPTAMGGPPTAMGGPPTAMGGPPTAMGGPPTAMGGPPSGMGSPPATLGAPPTGMGAPGGGSPAYTPGMRPPPTAYPMGASTTAAPTAPQTQGMGAAFMNPMTAPATQGGAPMPTSAPSAAPAAPALAAVDSSQNCAPEFMCTTTSAIPNAQQLAAKSGLPLGLCVQPLAPNLAVPEVNFGETGIVRCKRCRAYINPFVSWLDNGRRWGCNLCGFANDVPASYFCATDEHGRRTDAASRIELSSGSIEMEAPTEYMVRSPQPPVYVFLFDVSYNAVSNGLLAAACEAARDALAVLAENDRAQVSIITFDNQVHFYSLRATASGPNMLVCADITDVDLPVPAEELLVNLVQEQDLVEGLLERLPDMHKDNRIVDSALGPALDAAFKTMQHVGGKLTLFQASLASVGPGKLRPREAPKVLGSADEHQLLIPEQSPDGQLYKNRAVDFSRQQISVDLFAASAAYLDVATLGALSRYTGGSVQYYPAFNAAVDSERLQNDVRHSLLRETGFEAVMRVRCSAGLTVRNFYGNFFIRGADLLALPNATSDTAFNVELGHAEALAPGAIVTFQAALLYTSVEGQRRIRVHNMALPVTTVLADMLRLANLTATQNMIAKVGLDAMLRVGLPAARAYLHRAAADMARCWRALKSASRALGSGDDESVLQDGPGGVSLPPVLHALPELLLGLCKSVLFRGGNEVRTDERAAHVYRMLTMPMSQSLQLARPRVFALHELAAEEGKPCATPTPEQAGRVAGSAHILLPVSKPAASESFVASGALLVSDGTEMFLWLGQSVPGQLVAALFGAEVQSLAGVDTSNLMLLPQENDYSMRVMAIVDALRDDCVPQPKLHVVCQGSQALGAHRLFWRLVQDKQNFPGGELSLAEFLDKVTKESAHSATGMVAGAGVGAGPMPHGAPLRR